MKVPIKCAHSELWPIERVKPQEWNPNQHSAAQISLLAKVLRHQGWRSPIIISRLSGKIVAGHGRWLAAKQLGIKRVPVDWQEFKSESDEFSHLIADNRLAELSEWDKVDLAEVMELVDDAGLTGFNAEDLLRKNGERAVGKLSIGGEGNPLWLKNEVQFPSSNEWGIPDLVPDLIADLPEGIVTHTRHETKSVHRLVAFQADPLGSCSRENSILSFYVYDSVFSRYVDEPAEFVERLLDEHWLAVVTPNLSILPGRPKAQNIWLTFKVRWFSRYLQSVGIKIIPDVEWIDLKSLEWTMLGVPKRCKNASVQLQTKLNGIKEIRQRRDGLEWIEKELQPAKLLVYGANDHWISECRKIFRRTKPVFCESFHDKSRRQLNQKRGGEKHET